LLKILCTEQDDGSPEGNLAGWKLWVPQGLTGSVIRRAHDVVITAHGGMSKTLEIIRRQFY